MLTVWAGRRQLGAVFRDYSREAGTGFDPDNNGRKGIPP